MSPGSYLAFDLGAESGRCMLGRLEDRRLTLKELTRFSNGMFPLFGHWYWNIFRLFEEIKAGMQVCSAEADILPESLAVDTWGVDYGLLSAEGEILGLPYSYRDPRTKGAMEALFQEIPAEEVYRLTGIQFLPFNSLFQLYAMKRAGSSLMQSARHLLFMPDLFNYLLTGEKATEFTFATTTQLYNPRARDWEPALLAAAGVVRDLMQEIVPPGTLLGRLLPDIGRETGLKDIPVAAVASHDTASAVAAVPAEGTHWAYISSGTWSLMGIEVPVPIISDAARKMNFTNEGGVGETFRFLKNIAGLWLLQSCRKTWEKKRSVRYAALLAEAEAAPPFRSLIDPDHEGFLNPHEMCTEIQAYCRSTGQPPPETVGAFVRAILESLALKYRFVLKQLQGIAPHPIEILHVIGGGAQNHMLCQFTSDATGLPVIAGPAEATAVGNVMVQALASGRAGSVAEIRSVVQRSFPLTQFEPRNASAWEKAFDRFEDILRLSANRQERR